MGTPWFKLYAKDYLGDPEVRLLSDSDRGVLVDCWAICCAFGRIPTDPEALGKLLHRRPDHAIKAFLRVSSFFSQDPLDSGFMLSLRLASEQEAYQGKVVSNQINGRKGGRPKKNPLGSGPQNPQITEPEPEPEPEEKDKKPTVAKAPRKARTPKLALESLEEILKGGKGTPTWEAYWTLVGTFGGQAKNPAPKTTASLYAAALEAGIAQERIQARAQSLRAGTSEPRYMPQLAKWLEGQGYLTPDMPEYRKTNSRATDADLSFMAQLEEIERAS